MRDRVVAAASGLFAQRGFASTSIADVAAAAGILKGNLAYYFKTKEELLDAVLLTRWQGLGAELQLEAAAGDDPRSAILRLLDHVRRSAPELALYGCPVGGMAGELGRSHADLQPRAAGMLLGLEQFLSTQFGKLMVAADAARCAEHLLTVLQGAAVLAQAKRDPEVVARQVDGAVVWLDAVLAAHAKRRG